MKRVEIKWKQIDDYINSLLVAGGLDLSRKYTTHSKWEDEKVTLVCTQEENAEFTEEEIKRQTEAKTEKRVTKRPSYLENIR